MNGSGQKAVAMVVYSGCDPGPFQRLGVIGELQLGRLFGRGPDRYPVGCLGIGSRDRRRQIGPEGRVCRGYNPAARVTVSP